jgi:CRP/FNR family transcriptional regulator, cyclic AMP receptor protein
MALDSGRDGGPPRADKAEDGLARLPFLQGADPGALSAAAPLALWLNVAPGALVLDFGDTTNDVFFVAEGSVRVLVRTPLGQEVILGDLGPGDVFGEMAAIDGAPRSANVTALHASRLCRMPAAAFLEVALRSPPVAMRLMRILTARLRLQDERLFEHVVLPVRYRLASELLRLSRPRGGGDGRGAAAGHIVSPPPPQHVLAARVGARRETISLMLTELAREGLVEVSARGIVLPRPEALRAAISAELRGASATGPHRSGRSGR